MKKEIINTAIERVLSLAILTLLIANFINPIPAAIFILNLISSHVNFHDNFYSKWKFIIAISIINIILDNLTPKEIKITKGNWLIFMITLLSNILITIIKLILLLVQIIADPKFSLSMISPIPAFFISLLLIANIQVSRHGVSSPEDLLKILRHQLPKVIYLLLNTTLSLLFSYLGIFDMINLAVIAVATYRYAIEPIIKIAISNYLKETAEEKKPFFPLRAAWIAALYENSKDPSTYTANDNKETKSKTSDTSPTEITGQPPLGANNN